MFECIQTITNDDGNEFGVIRIRSEVKRERNNLRACVELENIDAIVESEEETFAFLFCNMTTHIYKHMKIYGMCL